MPAHPRDHAAPRTARDDAPRLLRARDVAITHEGSDAATPAAATLDVAPGEVVLLLGPSGSGKSTLTLALNGLIPQAIPAAVVGSLEVDGLDVRCTPVSTLSTRVGMVFQDPDAQLVTGTLLDEVAFGPENLRLPVGEVLGRAEAALRRVGLWERRRENPDRLSGGGRQRLAIACALALGSPLLVLDEPTANLDPRGIDEVYAALADIVAAGDRAILLVEHNLDAAVGLVDRVVVLDAEGRLFAEGSTDDVLRTRAGELHAMGVWLPVSTLAALRLRAAGYPLDPLPLTPVELTAALDAAPPPAISPRPGSLPAAASAPAPAFALPASSPHPTSAPAPASSPAPTSSPLPASPLPASPLLASSPHPASALAPASSLHPASPLHKRTIGPDADDPARDVRVSTESPRPDRALAAAAARPAATPAVTVRDLTIRRGGTEILHGVNLEIAAGEFVAIVGANGAGKTTLLQAIAGVIRPPKGSVTVGGTDVARTDIRTLARRVGFVFQNPEHQFITHTVFDEVAHGLRLQRLPDAEVHARTTEILARFGLTGKAATHPFLLSGGQKRRLSVGTALVTGAPVLALDEPTFGQDRARADELLALLADLNAAGTTVLVVSHDMQLVAEHADRVVVVDDGRIRAAGSTADILSDLALLESTGLAAPPLTRAMTALQRHPSLQRVTRLADLPGGAP
ncbi:energy-coupling factor transport system ATP-binding protein [Microbacterium sp. AK009]|uniref:ABC transporter ATP-binding protein n=1 Tax=Microbacterium sp. AK009 TaxID=2723068 RepID=UPI0015C6F5DE|nr:ABC transporter ATP-binding protein [Microbacterium sp. AK009]NYF18289.1 energy-coupling factor transport system ATP-binding protein [Microbacterium sp. AK009]